MANEVYTVMENDPTVICINGYVAYDVKIALSHSALMPQDAEEFTAKVVRLLNANL